VPAAALEDLDRHSGSRCSTSALINPNATAPNLIGRNGLVAYSDPFTDSMQMPLAMATKNPVMASGNVSDAIDPSGIDDRNPNSRKSRIRIEPNSVAMLTMWVRLMIP
jgi:hypothetical protein